MAELIPHAAVVVLFLILGFCFCRGKGSWLIAVYNTASRERKQKTDVGKLTRFMGRLMFLFAGCWLVVLAGCALHAMAVLFAGIGLLLVAAAAGVVYANTGNRFRRKDDADAPRDREDTL